MSIESEVDLSGLLRVGRIVAIALREMKVRLRAGVTTAELDASAAEVLEKHGARPGPAIVYGFPGTACISLNDEAVHGVPGPRVISPGDLVKLDVTAELDGYFADAAITVPIEPVPSRLRRLCDCAESALRRGLSAASAGTRVHAIGRAVEDEVRARGFTVLRGLCGHGVGRSIHEEPSVPNYYEPRAREKLEEGLVITIEPIISAGSPRVLTAADGWALRTADGSASAHFEHTIVITRGRPVIVTAA